MIETLIRCSDFEANHHSVRNGFCFHQADERLSSDGCCDDCYGSDTEFDMNLTIQSLLAKIWIESYDSWKANRKENSSTDEGSDDTIEIDDEDDLIEDQ